MSGEPACAWAVLGAWRGSKALFAQLVDRAGKTAIGEPAVEAKVIVDPTYDETFHSGEQFQARASPEVLDRLEAAEIIAGDPSGLRVHLRLQKDQYPRDRWDEVPYPRSGAVLTVQGADPGQVVAARDNLVGALRQGNLGRWPAPSRGEGDCAEAPKRALLSRGKWSDVGDIVSVALFLPFLAVLLKSIDVGRDPCHDDATKECTSVSLVVPSGSDLLVPLLIGSALAVVFGLLRYRRPSVNPALHILAPVEIADTSTARKAARVVYGLVTGVVPIASIVGWAAVQVFG